MTLQPSPRKTASESPPGGPMVALREQDPELIRKFEAYQSQKPSTEHTVDVLFDLFPYPWKDSEEFEEGIRLSLQGRVLEAIDLYSEILRQDPRAYPASHLLGYFHGCLGNNKEEVEYYKKTLKLNPDYPQIYLSLGTAYWLLGKERKAFEVFKQVVPMVPEFIVADHWFTFCFDRLGRYKSAYGNGGRGRHIRAHVMANACYVMGNAYIEFKLHRAARHAFKKAIRTKNTFAEAYFQLGEIHIKKLRNPKRAVKYLEQAEKLFINQNDLLRGTFAHQLIGPRDKVHEKDKAAEEWLKEGLRLQKDGRYLGAIDACRVAISFKPKYLEAYYNMGIAFGCLADAGTESIEKAIYAFKDSVRIQPEFVHAYIGLGASYIKCNRLPEAIEILTQAAAIKTRDSNVFYYLGIAYRMSRKFSQALEALKQVVNLKPDSIQAHFFLGLTYIDLERYPEACTAFQEAIHLKPDFAPGHHMLGNLYYIKLIDIEKALTHLKKAEKLFLKLEDYQQASRVRQLLMLHKE